MVPLSPSIPVITPQKSDSPFAPVRKPHLSARKCGCNGSWCFSCGHRKPIFLETLAVLAKWPYRRVRQIMVTIDPKRYGDHFEALQEAERCVSDLILRINRELEEEGEELRIVEYVAFTEFHEISGHPHYHIFCLTNKEGLGSQVGAEIISRCWPMGEVTWESYFKSESHQKAICGYARKTGYMEKDKRGQVTLPPHLQDSTKRIRRVRRSKGVKVEIAKHKGAFLETAIMHRAWWECKNGKWSLRQEAVPVAYDPDEMLRSFLDEGPMVNPLPKTPTQLRGEKTIRTNRQIMDACGKITRLCHVDEDGNETDLPPILIPYDIVKRMTGWRYVKNHGLVLYSNENCSYERFLNTFATVPLLPPPPAPPPPPNKEQARAVRLGREQGCGDPRLSYISG